MSKWKILPIEKKEVINTNRHEHFTKISVTKSMMYHEKQRYENRDEEHSMFAFEFHRKFSTSVGWEDRKAWAGLFGHRHTSSDPIITAKMKIKVEFSSVSQMDDFFNILEQLGVPTDKVKTKPNSRMVLDIDRDFHYSLIKALNTMSPFKDKMRQDVIAWHFDDSNCSEAQKFSDEVFGPKAVVNEAATVNPTEVPAVSVSVETDNPAPVVVETVDVDKVVTPIEIAEVKVEVPSDDVSVETVTTKDAEPLSENVMLPTDEVVNPEAENNNSQPDVEAVSNVSLDSIDVTEIKPLEKLITPPGSPTLFSIRNEAPSVPTPIEEHELEASNSPKPKA